ncbi:MAG: SDR family oxidoreductase [Paracoccaceae bacterium]
MQMTGNTVLVTGGASGIGLALAVALQAAGNEVIIAGRRQAALDAAVAAHPGLTGYVLDVADKAGVEGFAAQVIAAHPGLNVLVNNAGIMRAEDLMTPPSFLADAEATVATNLMGPIWMTAALLGHLRGQKGAAIINVTSGLAFVPLALTPTYSATKAALHSYTMSLRHQLRETGVEVLELAPPMVQTELMPGQATNPHGMPLADYVAEVMGLLGQTPTPAEICVGRVQFLRRAEAEGQMAQVFGMLNPVE